MSSSIAEIGRLVELGDLRRLGARRLDIALGGLGDAAGVVPHRLDERELSPGSGEAEDRRPALLNCAWAK